MLVGYFKGTELGASVKRMLIPEVGQKPPLMQIKLQRSRLRI